VTEPLSVGFLGLSHLHPRSYMPLFQALPETKVVAAADANPDVLADFTKDFPVRGYRDWRDLIAREELNLAVIFLPHADCPDAAVECARHGLHLLVEKPMAASAAGVRRMIAAAQEAGIILSTPYVWRYHPVAIEMKKLIDQGLTGPIVGCEGRCAAGRLSRYIEGHAGWMLEKARSGGGPMFNLGVHWIDLYRWLLADEVVEVMGKTVHLNRQYDIEDNCFALLNFSRGTVLALDISYTVPDSFPFGRDLYLAIRGAGGVLSWSPSFEGAKERLFVCSDSGDFSQGSSQHLEFDLPQVAGYAGVMGHRFLADFVESIRSRRPAAISGHDGLKALEVVEAICQSAESGRAVKF
jgi:predicted dehydrogenase